MSIMKLCTFKYQNSIKSGLIHDNLVYPINEINNYFDLDISDSISNIIKKQETKELEEIIKANNLVKIKNRAISLLCRIRQELYTQMSSHILNGAIVSRRVHPIPSSRALTLFT